MQLEFEHDEVLLLYEHWVKSPSVPEHCTYFAQNVFYGRSQAYEVYEAA